MQSSKFPNASLSLQICKRLEQSQEPQSQEHRGGCYRAGQPMTWEGGGCMGALQGTDPGVGFAVLD